MAFIYIQEACLFFKCWGASMSSGRKDTMRSGILPLFFCYNVVPLTGKFGISSFHIKMVGVKLSNI